MNRSPLTAVLIGMSTLVLSSRHRPDNQRLWRLAVSRGWTVLRATGPRVPPAPDADRDGGEVVIYVEALFGPAVAAAVGRELLDVPDDWLPSAPRALRSREVRLTTLGGAADGPFPAFVKPPGDKSFAAAVRSAREDLPGELDPATPALVSEPVVWEDEFRCFCLDGRVRAVSPYLRGGRLAEDTEFAADDGELAEAEGFAERVLRETPSPRAVVVDVGRIVDRGWAVVEANAAWGSGLYGCDAAAAFEVIRAATVLPD